MVDTSRIHALVARGRRRLRLQSAFETGTLGLILASVTGLIAVYAVRRLWITEATGVAVLIGACAIIVAGFAVGYFRRFPTAAVATRIDRASGLSDRLANACEFETKLRQGVAGDPETIEMMRAAVADAIRAVARANVKAATPFSAPRDLRPAAAFVVASAAVALLYIAPPEIDPRINAIIPAEVPRGGGFELLGLRFCGPDEDDMEADGACTDGGTPGAVVIGEGKTAVQASVKSWRGEAIELVVPANARIGKTSVRVRRGDTVSNPVPFEVLDPKDERALRRDAVVLDEDDTDFTRDLLDELRDTAEKTEDQHLQEFVNDVETLLEKAEDGQISKQELIEKLAEAQAKYEEGADENIDEKMAELAKTGQELKKEKLTRDLGEAMEKGDLSKAQDEMEKLADKMEKGELNDKEMKKVAEALDKASEKFDARQEKKEKELDKQIEQKQQQLERLKKQEEQAKTEREKQELARKKQKEERELQKLKREKEQREKSAMQKSLKSLHRNLKKSADSTKQEQGDQQQRRKYASENMRNAKQDTGKVEDEQRKIANQKKVASQMSDLKEAMRRAKQKGKGGNDRFGKNARNQDFRRRARGQKGSGQAWRPGSTGKGGQQGKSGQPGGQGNQPGGDSYGDGHDPDMMGDPTAKGGHTKDEQLQGQQGKGGVSTKETILTAAQKGFSSKSYVQVYGKYKAIVEEVINSEKVPSGYKYYVKKYFQKIKPHAM